MLIRIVRLTINPLHLDDFLALFDRISSTIRNTEGCEGLELLQDRLFPNVLATHSLWRDESYLEAYRKSDFFKSTWTTTKSYFAAPPSAHSYQTLREIGPK